MAAPLLPRGTGTGREDDGTARLILPVVSGVGGVSLSLSRSLRIPLLDEVDGPAATPPPASAPLDLLPASSLPHAFAPRPPPPSLGVLKNSSPPCPHLHALGCAPAAAPAPPPPRLASEMDRLTPLGPPRIGIGLLLAAAGTATTPVPTNGERNRLSYEVLRLRLRDGVLAPSGSSGGWSPPPSAANADSPPSDRSLKGGPRLWWPATLPPPAIEAGRADAEADQAATAEMAVAVDLDSLDELGVPNERADPERRGESAVKRLSQVDRRALHTRTRGQTDRHVRERAGRAFYLEQRRRQDTLDIPPVPRWEAGSVSTESKKKKPPAPYS